MSNITVKNNINVAQKVTIVSNARLWSFAGNEWRRLINPFTPFRTGVMAATAEVQASNNGAEIHYNAPYAKKQYFGQFNWRTDLHPLATGRWDTAAWPTQGKKLIDAMQAFIKRGAK